MYDKLRVFKNFALDLATLSKCNHRHVAAIITDCDFMQVYSIGVNGGPKGLAQCLCDIDGKYGCIHAEINALIKCVADDPNKVMIVTLAPCKQCASAIINAGIRTVYYIDEWKEDTGLQLLKAANVRVMCIKDM